MTYGYRSTEFVDLSKSATITTDNPNLAVDELQNRIRMLEHRGKVVRYLESCQKGWGSPTIRLPGDLFLDANKAPEAYAAIIAALNAWIAEIDAELARLGIVITPKPEEPSTIKDELTGKTIDPPSQ